MLFLEPWYLPIKASCFHKKFIPASHLSAQLQVHIRSTFLTVGPMCRLPDPKIRLSIHPWTTWIKMSCKEEAGNPHSRYTLICGKSDDKVTSQPSLFQLVFESRFRLLQCSLDEMHYGSCYILKPEQSNYAMVPNLNRSLHLLLVMRPL